MPSLKLSSMPSLKRAVAVEGQKRGRGQPRGESRAPPAKRMRAGVKCRKLAEGGSGQNAIAAEAEEEVDEVEDPCNCCGYSTANCENRIVHGRAEYPVFWHASCNSSHRSLERAAKAKDKEASKREKKEITSHIDSYRKLQAEQRGKWVACVLCNIIDEASKRTADDRSKAMELVECIMTFIRQFEENGVIMLPKRPFIQWYKREWGYDTDEATSQWEAACDGETAQDILAVCACNTVISSVSKSGLYSRHSHIDHSRGSSGKIAQAMLVWQALRGAFQESWGAS